jgi:hypothetical protein
MVESDMSANAEFVRRRRHDLCPAKALTRINIITHAAPRASVRRISQNGVIFYCDPERLTYQP